MASSTQNQVLRFREPTPEIRLENWPLRDSPGRAVTLLAAVLAVGGLAGWYAHSSLMGLASGTVLGLALWRWWTPVVFELGPGGLIQCVGRRKRCVAWTQISGYEIHRHGVRLCGPDEPSPWAFPGVYIDWGSRRDELLALVDFYLHRRSDSVRSSVSVSK